MIADRRSLTGKPCQIPEPPRGERYRRAWSYGYQAGLVGHPQSQNPYRRHRKRDVRSQMETDCYYSWICGQRAGKAARRRK